MQALYAECYYAECHYAECHYAECHHAEGLYAEGLYAECHYAECHGALKIAEYSPLVLMSQKHLTASADYIHPSLIIADKNKSLVIRVECLKGRIK
jgi:hypothetical protein